MNTYLNIFYFYQRILRICMISMQLAANCHYSLGDIHEGTRVGPTYRTYLSTIGNI